MKILMFCRFYEPHIGGVEKHVQKISEILIEKGFKIALITEKFKDDLSNKEEIEGVTVYRVKLLKYHWFNKFLIWHWIFKNLNLIREADIVHCHDIFFWYLPFRFLFPKKPVYITFHGWEGKFPVPKRYIFARKIWEKLAWGNICVGEYLRKWYGTNPNFVTYGGVNLNNLHSCSRKNLPNSIAFVGRLEKEKGILNFIDILKTFKKKEVDLIVEFYGDGSYRKIAEKFGKLYGASYDINDISSEIIYTSGYLSSIETMVAKGLVLTIHKNKLEEDIFKISPFSKKIFSGETTKEIINKILYYLSHPKEEKKLVEKGYRWARTQTWEKVADLYLKLWGVAE